MEVTLVKNPAKRTRRSAKKSTRKQQVLREALLLRKHGQPADAMQKLRHEKQEATLRKLQARAQQQRREALQPRKLGQLEEETRKPLLVRNLQERILPVRILM